MTEERRNEIAWLVIVSLISEIDFVTLNASEEEKEEFINLIREEIERYLS